MNNIGELITGLLESFDIRECIELNINKNFKIDDVFDFNIRFMWINSKLNFLITSQT